MCRVLIIDDSDFDRKMIRRALTAGSTDLKFEELDGGWEAVNQMTRQRPKLTILDIRMPGQDGFETLRAIRTNPETKDDTVILLSGSDAKDDRDLAAINGADDYYVKPPKAADYLDLGRNICRRYLPDYAA